MKNKIKLFLGLGLVAGLTWGFASGMKTDKTKQTTTEKSAVTTSENGHCLRPGINEVNQGASEKTAASENIAASGSEAMSDADCPKDMHCPKGMHASKAAADCPKGMECPKGMHEAKSESKSGACCRKNGVGEAKSGTMHGAAEAAAIKPPAPAQTM